MPEMTCCTGGQLCTCKMLHPRSRLGISASRYAAYGVRTAGECEACHCPLSMQYHRKTHLGSEAAAPGTSMP
uniref:Uncharacterized protein n=1 Tax=Anguilla anguilla TaxID=7936 RepID=A0A0E9W667_ANGAN